MRRRQTLPKSKSARQLIEENWRKQSIDYKSYELESLKKQIAEMQAEHDRKIREKGKSNQIYLAVLSRLLFLGARCSDLLSVGTVFFQ